MAPVPSSVSFPKLEEEILNFWKENRIFEKSLEKTKDKPPYIFYDGPPFATGMPHYGHILTSYIKDTIPRFFTMQGRFVDRRWGWDCHGLPIEYEIEKKLGISGKQAIEAYGIDQFNRACAQIVLKYADSWKKVIDRIGRWVDFSRQYRTMDLSYMESVMWVFKTLYDKGLIYESLKVVPYCNRCQTPLSNFETGLDDAYRLRDDPAVTVAFKDSTDPELFYLAWTTTPWTLPSNLALAVNPDLDYCLVEKENSGKLILAEARFKSYRKQLEEATIVKRFKGETLVGRSYLPLFDFAKETVGNRPENGNRFTILAADYVDAESGTGIVHTAPAFGEEDFNLCRDAGIDPFDPVGPDGCFTRDAADLEGTDVFQANALIIRQLKQKGQVFSHESYRHSYPHCWRCDNPLIYRTISSWYVKVTAFKELMSEKNRNINWIPDHIKEGRFGRWLEGARDWAISRNRFWGSPIPVWRCDTCNAEFVPGSLEQLSKAAGQKVGDLHRPDCDNIHFSCTKPGCKGKMGRVPEVLDCWFESGAMPYAQVHFPFENHNGFEQNFPASFIVEYVAQTRGWFYTLMVESAAIMEKHPFENAICHGVILADDGRKMSKSLKNFPDPMKVVRAHGSDGLRIYLLSSAVVKGADIRFCENGVKDSVRRYLIPLWNSFHFFTSYAELAKGYTPATIQLPGPGANMADRHILSELETLKIEVAQATEAYALPKCYARILDFIETLSGWYIRNNRERFWVDKINPDSAAAFNTLYTVLVEAARICAPFIPFTTEYIHRHLTEESVHLADWPTPVPGRLDEKLNQVVAQVRALIEGGRSLREKARINLRQPLPFIRVAGLPENDLEQFSSLIRQQLNVKEIRFEQDVESFAEIEIRLNAKTLGPVLKQNLKEVMQQVAGNKFTMDDEGGLMVGSHRIDQSDYEKRYSARNDKETVWSGRGLELSLNLEISRELRLEGLARNLNRTIQDARKKMGLAYDQRVVLCIEVDGNYSDSLATHRKWLMAQALAERIEFCVPNPYAELKDEDGTLKIQVIPVE